MPIPPDTDTHSHESSARATSVPGSEPGSVTKPVDVVAPEARVESPYQSDREEDSPDQVAWLARRDEDADDRAREHRNRQEVREIEDRGTEPPANSSEMIANPSRAERAPSNPALVFRGLALEGPSPVTTCPSLRYVAGVVAAGYPQRPAHSGVSPTSISTGPGSPISPPEQT
jgi:hypothetical protein